MLISKLEEKNLIAVNFQEKTYLKQKKKTTHSILIYITPVHNEL